MIRHTVVFALKHAAGSAAEKDFLEAADVLADIPGVQAFEKLKQVSGKNDYAFGFAMEFADQAAYQDLQRPPVACGLCARSLASRSGPLHGN